MAFGNEFVVIVSGGGAALMVSEKAFVSDCDNASVTVTVKFEVPVLVGVPAMVPDVLRLRFAGSEPVLLQASGGVPPVAVNV